MENKDIEKRSLTLEYRADGDSRLIEGYSLVFNSLSHDLGGFREQIDPRALDGVIDKSDILLLLNHDSSRGILGRSKCGKGSLKLDVDERGLRFSTDAPKTALGDETLEYLRRGDATQCSFAFSVRDDKWEKQGDGTYLRTILSFERLYDCSILTCTPAYESTSVSCRSFDEYKEKEAEELRLEQEKIEAEKREKEEADKVQAIKDAHDALTEQYKDYLKK